MHLLLIRGLAAATVFAIAIPVAAARLEVIALYGSQRLAGAEACFYRAGETRAPLERHLRFPEVRCFGADEVLEMPEGRWFYYVTHPSGLIAADATMVTVNRPHARIDEYAAARVQMKRAGQLDLGRLRNSIRGSDRLALYVSNVGTESLPMLLPIAAEVTSIAAPAAMPLVILVLRQGRVVDVTEPVVVASGERRAVQLPESARGATVIGWVEFAEEVRQPGDHWKRVAAPAVEMIRDGGRLQPTIAPRPGFGSDGALFIFRDVPPGAWRLSVSGRTWKTDEVTVGAAERSVIVAQRGLVTRPAAAVDVTWNVAGASGAADDASCPDVPGSEEQPSRVRLLVCEDLQSAANCRVAAEVAPLDDATRRARFGGLDPGAYLLSFVHPPFPPRRQIVSLEAGEQSTVHLQIDPFIVFGRLTMNGAPLRARVHFASGSAASDASGRYYAALAAPPRDVAISVRSCDGGRVLHTVIPPQPLEPNVPYDIDIRTNELTVHVTEQGSKRAIANAVVQIGVARTGGDDGDFLPGLPETDERGTVLIANVPTRQNLVVCAVREGYSRACAPAVRVGDERRMTVTVALPARRHRGRVISALRAEWGRVYFVAPDGVIRERTTIAADGSFEFSATHTSPAHVVLVWNGAMHVATLGHDEEPLELRPAGTTRTVEVRIAPSNPQRDALIGLLLGGLYIPSEALAFHQSARGLQAAIYGGAPLRLLDLPAGASIEVLLGPSPTDVLLRDTPAGADPFTLQHFSVRPIRKAVPPTGTVVF